MTADIDHFLPESLEQLGELAPHINPSMVTPDRDSHGTQPLL
jgi:hypothetical protein